MTRRSFTLTEAHCMSSTTPPPPSPDNSETESAGDAVAVPPPSFFSPYPDRCDSGGPGSFSSVLDQIQKVNP